MASKSTFTVEKRGHAKVVEELVETKTEADAFARTLAFIGDGAYKVIVKKDGVPAWRAAHFHPRPQFHETYPKSNLRRQVEAASAAAKAEKKASEAKAAEGLQQGHPAADTVTKEA